MKVGSGVLISRPLKVVLYGAFIGLLLASYIAPLQQIVERRAEVSTLETEISRTEASNDGLRQEIEDLKTPAGIERAARERYGMVMPGETVYIVPEGPVENQYERE